MVKGYKNKQGITFSPIASLNRGQIYEILKDSYHDLLEKYDPRNKKKYLESWEQADKDAFDNPDTIGKCIFATYSDDELIGFASWDPRHFPKYGIIGQNCVLSKYKGRGFGKLQIEKLLSIFKKAKCKKVIVSTGNNEFFIPAQKMYESLGFVEIAKHLNEKWGFNEIEYEKTL